MRVLMLQAVAGDAFSYGHGELVELDKKIATAWIDAGVAAPAPAGAAAATDLAELRDALDLATRERDGYAAENLDLRTKLAAAEAARGAADEAVALHQAEILALRAGAPGA